MFDSWAWEKHLFVFSFSLIIFVKLAESIDFLENAFVGGPQVESCASVIFCNLKKFRFKFWVVGKNCFGFLDRFGQKLHPWR